LNGLGLLAHLRERKITLWLEGNRLRFRAPDGALTIALREAIASQRDQIIATLREKSWPAQRCTICDHADWVDQPSGDGRIRTTCRVCGRFIGYLPAP